MAFLAMQAFPSQPRHVSSLPFSTLLHTHTQLNDCDGRYGHGSYDPIERIWRWLPAGEGPFETAAEFKDAWRRLLRDEAKGDKLRLYIVRWLAG